MNELLKVDFDTQTVSARDLYTSLSAKYDFTRWCRSNLRDFVENEDYFATHTDVSTNQYGGFKSVTDYRLTINTAKHICLMAKTEEGKKCRQYLIDLENAWNTPEQIMARALIMAKNTINSLKVENKSLTEKIEADKPKTIFADAVATSHTSILVGDLAKLICQNGVQIGQKRLFEWLRDNGYLIKSGNSKNMPTQRYLESGLFEVKESTIQNPDGSVRITKTTKITGKGQQYFVNKFLN